jgi:hypothetical protein
MKTVSQTNRPESAATSKASPAGEQSGETAQPVEGAALEPALIAERAYELYIQRDGQDDRAVEDWLEAERQLLAPASHKQ